MKEIFRGNFLIVSTEYSLKVSSNADFLIFFLPKVIYLTEPKSNDYLSEEN